MTFSSTSLIKIMEEMFISKQGSDVTFIIHGEELRAHKFILVNRSTVFKAMIEGPMAPENQRHEISDPEITYGNFENFLRFLYNDKCDMKKPDIRALIHLASFYNIPYVLEKCCEKIRPQTSEDAYEYAEIALKYMPATSALLDLCFRHLFTDLQNVPSPLAYWGADGTHEWISSDLVLEMLKKFPRDGRVNEDSLFKIVLEWAKNVCIRQNPTSDEIQEIHAIMTPLMQYFHLKELSLLTLATTIRTYKLIPAEELVTCLSECIIQAFDESSNLGRGNANRGGGRGANRGYRTAPNTY